MEAPRVVKFGGALMGSVARIRAAALKVLELEGPKVVVVSAMAGETDRLLALGQAAGGAEANAAELDVLAAAGEQAASALLAISLNALGAKSRSFQGHELPIRTDSAHGHAAIHGVGTRELQASLSRGEIPVISGFQGISLGDRITTLGRGGSDLTAVAVAAALGSAEVIFEKDVQGVLSADPRVCPDARKIEVIAYRHMLALSEHGAKILHAKSVALALKHRLRLRVSGTLVVPDTELAERSGVLAVATPPACERATARASEAPVTLIGDFPLESRREYARRAVAVLEELGIAWGSVATSASGISLRADESRVGEAARQLHEHFLAEAAVF